MKNVPADALDKLLGKFFKDVRKQNGGEYEPDSLSSFQRSIQRRLKELKLSLNILKDEEFCRSREVLAAKRKNLVKQGRGNKPNACRELTSEEEEKLFESGAFGCHARTSRPPSLINDKCRIRLDSKFLFQVQAFTSQFFLSTIAAVRCSVQFPTRAVSAFKRCRTIHSSRRQPSDQFQTAYLLFTREIQPAALKKM